ncbi:MAG: EAL domain-containing protein [Acidimicrobiales bacterium]
MYQVRRRGGAGHQTLDLTEAERLRDDHLLTEDLRAAVSAGDLTVAYQPIVHLRSGTVASVEALLRWTHPDRGPVAPLQIIRLAEENGLIDDDARRGGGAPPRRIPREQLDRTPGAGPLSAGDERVGHLPPWRRVGAFRRTSCSSS